MTGLISGTVYSVQRESTTLTGVPVGAERVEGGMGYASDQTLLETVPATIKTLYSAAKATTDPAPCSSTFAMVKVADSADCAWVRANQATLFGP
jgi:hypothetical protein